MKTLCLIGAGVCRSLSFLTGSAAAADAVWCADGGLTHAQNAGITPDLLLGDLDSYPGTPPEGLPTRRFPPEKDDTDTVLAIRLAQEAGFTRIRLLCMTGGRIDHTLANLQTLFFGTGLGLSLTIDEPDYTVFPLCGGEALTLPPAPDGLFSVFAHSDLAEGVSISGAYYPLTDAVLTNEMPLGISNRRTDRPTRLSLARGRCLVFVYQPEEPHD